MDDIFDILPGLTVAEVIALENPDGVAILFMEGTILTIDDEFGATLIQSDDWEEIWEGFNS